VGVGGMAAEPGEQHGRSPFFEMAAPVGAPSGGRGQAAGSRTTLMQPSTFSRKRW
jgi:hypothetical protein